VARRNVTLFDRQTQRFASSTDQLAQAFADFAAPDRLVILCGLHDMIRQVIDDMSGLSLVHAPIVTQVHREVEDGLAKLMVGDSTLFADFDP
jgi:hypothetical protein